MENEIELNCKDLTCLMAATIAAGMFQIDSPPELSDKQVTDQVIEASVTIAQAIIKKVYPAYNPARD